MTVKKIIKKWLKDNGYDGLYVPGECACRLDDLFPCSDEGILGCEAGYLQPCDGGKESGCDGDCDFHIGAVKPKEVV